MEFHSLKKLPLLVFCLVFSHLLLSQLFFYVQAQSIPEGIKGPSVKSSSDSLRVVKEIAASREIHRNKHDEALEYQHAERAVELSMNMGDTLLYARSLDNLGLLNRYHQQYEDAINLHGKAFGLIEHKEGASLAKMIYANNAGVACRYAGKYNQAVEYYLKALKIAEEEQDLKNIAISSNGLGNTLVYLPNREEDALKYFERSLSAEKERNNSLGVAMNFLSISDFYIQKGAFSKAREYLTQLLKLNEEREDLFGLAITYEFFGLCYLEEGKDLQKANTYFQRSLKLFSELNNTHKQADVLFHLGKVSQGRERYPDAIDYYNKSWNLAKEINSMELLKESAHQLSAVYEEQGKLTKSLEYYKIFHQYKDSVALIEQETQIAAIEKRFAIEKKESQIALLEKDKVLQAAQLQSQEETLGNQRLVLLLLLIGLLAILVITMMQYRSIQAKRKSNLLLKHQRDEISLQKDEIEKVNAKLEETFEQLIDQQKENEERQVKLLESKFENKIQSLALQSLESQMNPHFLFNGMNAVRWLVIQNKNEKAKKYLDTFANLLRLSLTNNRKEVIALSEELTTTSLYLEIESLRFDNEFSFSVNISPGINVDKIMVPPKILQPLAENAVKHGLLPSRKMKKKLEINVKEKEDGICVEVIDNGMGFKRSSNNEGESRPDGTHLGLKLIQERLSIYNQQSKFLILFNIGAQQDEQKQTTGTRAEIWIARQEVMKLATS